MLFVRSRPAVQRWAPRAHPRRALYIAGMFRSASGGLARLAVLLGLTAVALLVVASPAESQGPIASGYGEAPGIVVPPPSNPRGPGSTTGAGLTATNPPARLTASAVDAARDHGAVGSGKPTIDPAPTRELRAGPAGVGAKLPFTGADLGVVALCALVLLLSGTVLRRASRPATDERVP